MSAVIVWHILCGQQEIALRGHDESAKSMNRGNFREILNLVSNHDDIVRERLCSGPRNATYTSPEIQNMLLHNMGGMVQSIICSKIQEAGIFSLLVDESKDHAKKEQLTIVLRCVDPKEFAIQWSDYHSGSALYGRFYLQAEVVR